MHRALSLALLALLACGKGGDRRADDVRPGVDAAPIDITGFPGDPEVTSRILHMNFPSVAARLGSLVFEARTYFVFSRAGEEQEQHDLWRVAEDASGNVHMLLDTQTSQLELFLIGEDAFIRQDKGRLRKKPRREATTNDFEHLAWSSVYQSMALFGPRLRFVDARPESLGGRQTVRYGLAFAQEGDGSAPPLRPAPASTLPIAPPARWRELARPLDVTGNLWIDAASGVVLKLKVEGRFEIPDRDVRPTQLTLRHDAAISNIGKVKALTAPEHIDELERVPAPGDPISFFRAELAAEEARLAPAVPPEGKATTPAKAPATKPPSPAAAPAKSKPKQP